MIPLYTGFDPRESIGWHAFTASVIANTQDAVAFIPLHGPTDGTNAFTRARFLVPTLQRYKGFALFADASDMVCCGDITELWAMRDATKAVQVVKHEYKTRHRRKYVGTAMEADNTDYYRKNWASLMLINCEHPVWRDAPAIIETPTIDLLQLAHVPDKLIGALPPEWNWLVDEYGINDGARILHWTAGIPAWPAYADAPMADRWARASILANHATV